MVHSTGKTAYLAFDNYLNPFDLEIARLGWNLGHYENRHSMESFNEPAIPEVYYAISVNQLYEFPWALRDRDGTFYFIDNYPMKALQAVNRRLVFYPRIL